MRNIDYNKRAAETHAEYLRQTGQTKFGYAAKKAAPYVAFYVGWAVSIGLLILAIAQDYFGVSL